ncbi:EAL domain-containing protein [Belnapia rosea]|uniref:EAL domain, c-di-GMP-specific phosphodiesterase class I (Or its enzymatically inactive variant) n=1 Tax=Belnapia rosea TaxID=938405 RepID=A0A1G6VNS7_9PROT|nr:EAL domain, c-di-GMP-specific phosphodiesterase class I (or its enzymatically inactive variant) [Belnapia rosea]SDD54525.1 EAL domain, c-di-GMP-specific phosphodiesterase class I (or its enzymatically inactive variant) [Belnapia rosea]
MTTPVPNQNARSAAGQPACAGCREGDGLDFELAMAFQPILDGGQGGRVHAHEALVRGPEGQGAGWVIDQVAPEGLYAFDQACRVAAIEEASRLRLAESGAKLAINFLPNAVYNPVACIQATLQAANRTGFPTNRLIFEVSERERVHDPAHLLRIFQAYRQMGFTLAIDDFGAGHAGLALLADLPADLVKLDMGLVRGCDTHRARQVILAAMIGACRDLGVQVVAEGIETEAECAILRDMGVDFFQGYLFARPGFRSLPVPERSPFLVSAAG